MSRIIVPSRRGWTRQPQRQVEIDWSNPLARGLVFAFNPAIGMRNLANGDIPLNTSADYLRSIGRSGIRFDGAISCTAEFSPAGLNQSGNSLTLFSIWRAKDSQFLNSDDMRALLSTRTSGNRGWTWSRISASSGGITGNVTRQDFTIQGVGAYTEPVFTIESLIDTSVAVRVNGTTASFFRNGVRSTADITVATATTGGNIVVGGQGPYGSSLQTWVDRFYCIFAWTRPLTDVEIAELSSNPWQIFKPRTRHTIIDLGASGLSSVYADSALNYYIRSLLSSDSGIQYAIRNAIYKDDAVGYYLRSAIAQNSEVGYVLRSAIAKDDAEAYKIRGLVQSSDAETYSIRGLVQTSDGEAYKIRSQVQADASTSYDIQSSTSVASSNAVNYSVRGSVAASVLVGYSVRGSAQKDIVSAYSVRSAVSRDVVASYSVSAAASSVYADSTASYSVDGVVPSGPSAESIAAAVLTALQGTTIPVDTKKMNGADIVGDGSEANPWRGVGVQP